MRQYKDGSISFSNEEQMCIVANCQKYHLSITKILNQYGLPYRKKYAEVIKNIFNKYNFDYEKDGNKYHRKYFFDEHYFDNIDCDEKAYWLGFFYADGYLSGNKSFGCALKKDDVSHLRKFLTAININKDPISHSESTNSCGFVLSSEHLYKVLGTYGFSNNKSYDQTDKPFNVCPYAFKKSFIRGLWDGDGYVSVSGEGKNITGVISNNEMLLEAIVSFVNDKFNDEFCKVTKSDGYPRIKLTATKAKSFLDWIYSEASVYLGRKYNNYMKLSAGFYSQYPYHNIRKIKSGRYFLSFTHNNVTYYFGTFDTIKEAVDKYNEVAPAYEKPLQKYIGEIITKEEYAKYLKQIEEINNG